jgi:hypothetical protein
MVNLVNGEKVTVAVTDNVYIYKAPVRVPSVEFVNGAGEKDIRLLG